MAVAALQKAINSLAILEVTPRSLNAYLNEPFQSSMADVELTAQWRHSLKDISLAKTSAAEEEENNSQKLVLFTIETGFRFVTEQNSESDESDDSNVFGAVLADFRAAYIASEDLDLDCLNEFGQRNALFHVWPYWRELVQSTCARFGFPQIVLPMYQVPESTWTVDEDSTERPRVD